MGKALSARRKNGGGGVSHACLLARTLDNSQASRPNARTQRKKHTARCAFFLVDDQGISTTRVEGVAYGSREPFHGFSSRLLQQKTHPKVCSSLVDDQGISTKVEGVACGSREPSHGFSSLNR